MAWYGKTYAHATQKKNWEQNPENFKNKNEKKNNKKGQRRHK
jgi:hypothetical protein